MAWHQFSPCICNTFQCFLSTKFTGKQKKKIQQEEMGRKRQKRGCFFGILHPMKIQCCINAWSGGPGEEEVWGGAAFNLREQWSQTGARGTREGLS